MPDPKVLWSPAGYLVFPDVPGKTDGLYGTDSEDLCLCVSTKVATSWPLGFCKSKVPNLAEPDVLQCLDCLEIIKAMLVIYAKAVGYYPAPEGLGPKDFREPTSLELIDALSKLREVPDRDYNIRRAIEIVEKYLYGKE